MSFLCLVNGYLFASISFAQSATDSTSSVADSSIVAADADTLINGVKFIYRAPSKPVSQKPAVSPGKLYYIKLSKESYETLWDSLDTYKVIHEINGINVSVPTIYNFQQYAASKKREQQKQISYELIREGIADSESGRGLLDFSLQIPGGESSVFSTIFGKPTVNLRVNGSANMNVGVSIQNVDDPNLDEDLRRRIDPTFNQNLQLNIQGTIGDKLTIATDWDTERQFDYQNRLSIVYEGYEDEIIKRIEMGNVSMETGNSLIRGGTSLFGIKSIAELGALRVTSVISQQKGESNAQTISGGSQEQEIRIRPAQYQNNRNFFIDFYNRQQFELNVSDPQQLGQAYQISDLRVWISEPQINTTDAEAVRAAAFVDLGVVENPDGTYGLPSQQGDSIADSLLENNRENTSASASDFNVSGNDFYNGYFRPLREGADYTVNKTLGYITLNRNLNSGSLLAVSFVRRGVPGEGVEVVEVGDISPQSSGLSYFKLLRTDNPTPDLKSWPLTMRNIYSLGVSNLTEEGLELDIKFTRGNVDELTLPGRNLPMLRELGLDRVNSQGAPNPDSRIDFSGIVFNPSSGTIMFPYLEPFGQRIEELLEETGASEAEIEELAYFELYNERQNTADISTKNNFYSLEGVSKGGVSGTFSLGLSIVEGSVKVFASGAELQEGVDYEVDYSFGMITILSERYLSAGQDITVEYESNQFQAIGQKNFTGFRAEYEVTEDIHFGGTYFKLKEQPLSDKIRVGDEALNNTLIGFDANAEFDTPWLTRFIDQIPLLQTKEESNMNISGEFAQFRPGVAQTNAVRDAIKNDRLFEDEENGLSFIDDFEGSELSISFTSATRWNLAAAPAAVPGYTPDINHFENPTVSPDNSLESKIARSDLRSQFSWYTIPRNINSILGGVSPTPESEQVLTEDVFPGRETNNVQEEVINTLDVYYNPTVRGPYNYNFNLRDNLENSPEDQWGGMTAALPSGQEDLTQNNIEFIEFWVQPILPNGQNPAAGDIENYDGKLYIDIGVISEDVVPNFTINSEDGLANSPQNLELDSFGENARSYVPSNPTAPQGQFSNEDRDIEDVGFDGIPSANGFDSEKVETALFSEFIDSMRVSYGENSPEFQLIEADPSNDDYVFYGESKVQDFPLHRRFHRLLGYHEGNTPVAGGDKKAITPRPDTEGLVSRSNVEANNNYYQYEVDLNPADFNSLEIGSEGTYIVDKVPGTRQQDRWHLVRIPLNEFKRKVGDIEGFQNISHIRVWMSGYEKPFTLRFATFEFIGSQWRKVENLEETLNSTGEFRVSTINIEENANREPVPYRQPEGAIRALNRGIQVQSLENEQAVVLGVEGLGAGDLQMVKKVYPGGLNLLNYSNMRMFIHGEGYWDQTKADNGRQSAEVVVRIGNDLDANYYEYRQPVTPSNPNFNYSDYSPDAGGTLEEDAEEVWLYEENSMNIILAAFNELKQLRDQQENANNNERFEIDLDSEGAVEGAVIAIKGNPSLGRVNEIGLGVRNPYDPTDVSSPGSPSLDGEFWLNELRVSGFDNEKGWKANAKASFKLADFATINTNFIRTTTGFGGLDSRLGARSVADEFGYDLSSTVNLHKFIPDRFGWSFPVTITTRKNISTPKYLPNQGDIRLQDFINATNSNPDLTETEKEAQINQRISDIETVRDNFSVNVSNISKQNSQSKLAQYTIDNTQVSYNYSEGSLKNPEIQFQEDWNYTSSVQYNLSFNNVKLWQPFGFTEGVPVASVLSNIRLGYMPSSITASANLNRAYTETRNQARLDQEGLEIVQPLRQSHTFNQRSTFGFNYNLTPSIPISFRTNTNFDLSAAGIEDRNKTGLEVDSSSYQVLSTFDALNSIITDTVDARRSNYTETYTASWRPDFTQFGFLDWFTYSASYSGGYGWTNSPAGSNLGANISNSFRLDHTVKFAVGDLLDKVGIYNRMLDADAAAASLRNGNGEAEADSTGPGLFGNVKYYGRKLVIGLLSLETVDISYNNNKTSNQAGYSGDSQFYYAFADQNSENFSPSLGYRLGLNEEVSRAQLIQEGPEGRTITLPKNNNYSDDISLGTNLDIFRNITVDLSWNTAWDERRSDNIALNSEGEFSSTIASSGNISSSSWSFGGGYEDLFKRQLQTAFDDYNGTGVISDEAGNGDGRVVLNRNTLEEDFRRAYLGGGNTTVGKKGYTPIPKPNWSVTWSGLESYIPFIGNAMSRASLSHTYTGSYRMGWNLNTITGEQTQRIGAFNVIDFKEDYEPTSINVEQRFSPMAQLNITWQSGLRTQIGYEKSRLSSLAMSSRTVTERTSQGFKGSINYTFQNITLPFLSRLTNNIAVTITGSLANDSDKKYTLSQHVVDALNVEGGPGNLVTNVNAYDYSDPIDYGQKRINSTLTLGYRLSQTVTSNFEYTFSKVEPKSSITPPRTNHEIRFNFRININSR